MDKVDEALVFKLATLAGITLDAERLKYLTPQVNDALKLYEQFRPADLFDGPAIVFNPVLFAQGGFAQ